MKLDSTIFEILYGVEIEFDVKGVSQASNLKEATLAFSLTITSSLEEQLQQISNVVIFLPVGEELPEDCYQGNIVIHVINPRYEYIKTASRAIKKDLPLDDGAELLSYVHQSANIDKSVVIEPFCFIGPNCTIKAGCHLHTGVKIIENVVVGRDTKIGPNSVIGMKGFGIERDNGVKREVIPFGGRPLKMPHFGGVRIDDGCDIGALNTICAGAIEPTIIGKDVMTDDHVHIAHNCKIEAGVAIAACAEISGSVLIEEECWVGPNVSIMQKVTIGRASTIGIGSVVRKSMPPQSVVAGNPARIIK